MSRKHRDKGKIEGLFVPMLISTISSPAWRAMSPYAREVFMRLRSRYSFEARNNGRLYLSVRKGAEETGFSKDIIARSLRELQHYGFTVMTKAGHLGVEGKGVAPHFRLTELGYMHDPPTRDFLKWNGEPFHEQKSPAYYKRRERSMAKLEKQNPVQTRGTRCPHPRDIPVSVPAGQLPEKVSVPAGHISEQTCPDPRDISRVNHLVVPEVSGRFAGWDAAVGFIGEQVTPVANEQRQVEGVVLVRDPVRFAWARWDLEAALDEAICRAFQ